MKRVTNISIGERVFSIEEDAFSVLNKYLNEIWDYFKTKESDEEILKDIEYSIAEKLDNKNRSTENAVNTWDVESIISELWTLEELTDGDATTPVIPEEKNKRIKQLYRDPENKVIAWVWSGIANYFWIDPVVIRVAFVVFVFISGAWIVLYLVLWVIVPIAKTASQKLAMRWEAANLESITEFFEEKVKKKSTKNILVKIINFPFILLGLLFWMLNKVMPILRVLIWIAITLVASLLTFILCSLFLLIAGGWTWVDIDAVTLEFFTQIKNLPHYALIYWSTFSIIFIPLFLTLIWWIYLIFKRKVMWINVFVVLFIFWLISFSVFVTSIVRNHDTIKNVVEKIADKVDTEGNDFHIHIN